MSVARNSPIFPSGNVTEARLCSKLRHIYSRQDLRRICSPPFDSRQLLSPSTLQHLAMLLLVIVNTACTHPGLLQRQAPTNVDGLQHAFRSSRWPQGTHSGPLHLKVVVVHGVGKHQPGYSLPLQRALVSHLQLIDPCTADPSRSSVGPQFRPLEISLNSDTWAVVQSGGEGFCSKVAAPSLTENSPILSINRYSNEGGSRVLSFFEITWSPPTEARRAPLLALEAAEGDRRAHLNRWIKERVLNSQLSDAVTYLGYLGPDIRTILKRALCWLWTDDPASPNKPNSRCSFDNPEIFNSIGKSRYSLIGLSLGSKIIFDTLVDEDLRSLAPRMLERTEAFYMLANQLPLLELTEPELDKAAADLAPAVLGEEFESWLSSIGSSETPVSAADIRRGVDALNRDSSSRLKAIQRSLYMKSRKEDLEAAEAELYQKQQSLSASQQQQDRLDQQLDQNSKNTDIAYGEQSSVSSTLADLRASSKQYGDQHGEAVSRKQRLQEDLKTTQRQLSGVERNLTRELLPVTEMLSAMLNLVEALRDFEAASWNYWGEYNKEWRDAQLSGGKRCLNTAEKTLGAVSTSWKDLTAYPKFAGVTARWDEKLSNYRSQRGKLEQARSGHLLGGFRKEFGGPLFSAQRTLSSLFDPACTAQNARWRQVNQVRTALRDLLLQIAQLERSAGENRLQHQQAESDARIALQRTGELEKDIRRLEERLKGHAATLEKLGTQKKAILDRIAAGKDKITGLEQAIHKEEDLVNMLRKRLEEPIPTGIAAVNKLLSGSADGILDAQISELQARIDDCQKEECELVGSQQDAVQLLLQQLRPHRQLLVVSISDPNDLLSYPLPPNLSEQLPQMRFVDVQMELAPEYFNLFADPRKAHEGHLRSVEALRLISCGGLVRRGEHHWTPFSCTDRR